MKNWYVHILLLLTMACLPKPDAKEVKVKPYYDIEGLIDRQTHLLDSINPSFMKVVVVDGKEEILEGKNTDDKWKGELEILRSYDLNKATLTGKYNITVSSDSTRSVTLYISKYPGTTRVDTLMLTFDRATGEPVKIHAHVHSSNILFESGQKADMEFTTNGVLAILNSYRIEGWQRLLSKPSSQYTITSQLDVR